MAGLGHNGPPGPIDPPALLREIDVFAELRRACDAAGGQKAWCDRHGIAAQHLNDVLMCRRQISDRILAALGLARVTRYARVSIPPRAARSAADAVRVVA
jgi:hypothetical protein